MRPPGGPHAATGGEAATAIHRGRQERQFVLEKGSSGKYHFNLLVGDGQVITTSQHYDSKESALHGIESVKTNPPGAETDDKSEK